MPTFTTYREASKDEMGREIDRCHKVIADLEARLARVPDREAVARALYAFEMDGYGCSYDDAPVDWVEHERRRADAVLALFAAQETKP